MAPSVPSELALFVEDSLQPRLREEHWGGQAQRWPAGCTPRSPGEEPTGNVQAPWGQKSSTLNALKHKPDSQTQTTHLGEHLGKMTVPPLR